MSDLRKNFAKTLKELRKGRDLSLINLGELTGISYATLSRYENEKQFPGDEELEILADFFCIPVSHFLDNESQEYDSEALEILNMLENNEDLRMLFLKTASLTEEEKKQIARVLKATLPEE